MINIFSKSQEISDPSSKEILSLLNLKNKEQKESAAANDKKFKEISKECPNELKVSDTFNDKEISDAFLKLEEAIKRIKASDSSTKEYSKLQLQNRINSLLYQLK